MIYLSQSDNKDNWCIRRSCTMGKLGLNISHQGNVHNT